MAKRSVLIVEDDEAIVGLMRTVLEEDGLRIVVARNGDEALAIPGPLALAVLDMFIPGVSGRELVVALRAKHDPDLPVLITSASAVAEEALAVGAYEYLAKPFDLDALSEAVRRGLRHLQ